MADILIRGMTLPEKCFNCRMCWQDTDKHWYCEANKPWGLDVTDSYLEARHPDCPLIELKQHGRLIDADAFISRLEIGTKIASDIVVGEIAAVYSELTDGVVAEINKCPTVIEASEVE